MYVHLVSTAAYDRKLGVLHSKWSRFVLRGVMSTCPAKVTIVEETTAKGTKVCPEGVRMLCCAVCVRARCRVMTQLNKQTCVMNVFTLGKGETIFLKLWVTETEFPDKCILM